MKSRKKTYAKIMLEVPPENRLILGLFVNPPPPPNNDAQSPEYQRMIQKPR